MFYTWSADQSDKRWMQMVHKSHIDSNIFEGV